MGGMRERQTEKHCVFVYLCVHQRKYIYFLYQHHFSFFPPSSLYIKRNQYSVSVLSQKDLRKKIQEINWQRKNEQTQSGTKLRELETSWVGLVSKNYEIERACVELEKEVADMEERNAKMDQMNS